MTYQIKAYTKSQARKLGVKISPSNNQSKKIDVFKDGKLIAQVGQRGASDYPTYMVTKGKEYADERRRLYKIRHKKDRNVVGSNGYYADRLLW